ncbi:MAG: PHP domain-containing protein [Coprobacillus sp.]
MVYADLHVHTNHSDGTKEIKDVLQMAIDKGIKAIAITDHDTLNHYDEVKSWGEKLGIEIIRGVEMSCYDEEVGKKIHIIGLYLNENAEHVERLCQATLKCRDIYHHQLIEKLKDKAYHIKYEDAKKYSPYNIVFKIHIFLALMAKYPHDMSPAKYRELFASKTSKEVDKQMGYIDIKEGIEAIHKDGGIAIIAHPCEYDNYDEIEKYVGYGLEGIEISHPSMREDDYTKVNEFVNKFDFVCSGGSDFHDESLTLMGNHGLSYEQFMKLKEYVKKVKR